MTIKIYQQYSYAIFGSSKVGKTNIISRFVRDQFFQTHKNSLENIHSTQINIDGKIFQINLHDTAGHQRIYSASDTIKNNQSNQNILNTRDISIRDIWRSNKNGFIFTFALNCQSTFWNVVQYIKEVKKCAEYKNVGIILVGNKKDLKEQRKIDRQTIQSFAQNEGIKYFEISAKQSAKEQINKIIYELIDINEMNFFIQDTFQIQQQELLIKNQFQRTNTNSSSNKKSKRETVCSKEEEQQHEKLKEKQRQKGRWFFMNRNPCEDVSCQII